MNSTAHSWDEITANEYRRGYPGASPEDIALLVKAENALGWPPDSLEHARSVVENAKAAPAEPAPKAPEFDPAAVADVVGKVVDEKLAGLKAGPKSIKVRERDAAGRATDYEVT